MYIKGPSNRYFKGTITWNICYIQSTSINLFKLIKQVQNKPIIYHQFSGIIYQQGNARYIYYSYGDIDNDMKIMYIWLLTICVLVYT